MEANIILPDQTACSAESAISAVSWPAIFAGGVTAFGIAFILLALGAGIGLSTVSPYTASGISVTTFSIYAAVWLIVVQWLSSALGAYVTGRLRTKWVNLHSDEVRFRDTAHGLLAWAVAVVLGVGLFGLATTGAKLANAPTEAEHATYYADELFRSSQSVQGDVKEAKSEATRIFVRAAANRKIVDDDKNYLGHLVAARTGLSTVEAAKRVDDVVSQAQAEVEVARKAAAKASIYVFFSMLIGAFIASVGGAIGGQHRDQGSLLS